MHEDAPVGNPYVATETAAPSTPWTDDDLATPESVRAMLDRVAFPLAENRGFWFAYQDSDPETAEIRLATDVARPHRVVPMRRHDHGLYTLRFPAPEVDRLEYSFQRVGGNGDVQWLQDGRNPRSVATPFGSKSEAVAREYAPPEYTQAVEGVPHGTLREIPVPGPRGQMRNALVWRAAGHRLEERLPLLVFLDGPEYMHFAGVRRALDSLVASGRLAPCRALLLPPGGDRFDEYSANGRCSAWLTGVLPRVLARYFPVPRQPERCIGIGASLGGLALLHAHWTRPGFFGKLILQSGSFFYRDSDAMEAAFVHFGRICRFVRGIPRARHVPPPVPVRMTCGLAEENLVNNRRIRPILEKHGYPVTLTEVRDAHNWVAWRDSLGAELAALLPA